MMQRLARLRDKDDTWCVISSLEFGVEISRMMEMLDPALGKLLENSHSFQLGIRYGSRFEVEYMVNAASHRTQRTSRTFKSQSMARLGADCRFPRVLQWSQLVDSVASEGIEISIRQMARRIRHALGAHDVPFELRWVRTPKPFPPRFGRTARSRTSERWEDTRAWALKSATADA